MQWLPGIHTNGVHKPTHAGLLRSSYMQAGLSWRFLGAGGSAAQPVLWGAGASNSFQLSNFDVASGAVTEQATLPSTGLQSVERLAVDPQVRWAACRGSTGSRAAGGG